MTIIYWPFLLIGAAVVGAAIYGIAKAAGSKNNAAAVAVAAFARGEETVSAGGAKIFINGGEPLSGDILGHISVDGRALPLHYSEMPIEIAIESGKHYVIIEGGQRGDARIDRGIDFGANDVLTVDMPGFRDDKDVIRFQIISQAEYRRALTDCRFTVTRKAL